MQLPSIPASYFAVVPGLAGLGGAWRVASRVWHLPAFVGETLMLVAGAVWACLVVLYVAKWLVARKEALAELEDPVQCCFVGLIGVSISLVALAALPYSSSVANIGIAIGASLTLLFALWRTGRLWHGERNHATTTPILYLPLVAGAFVTATALGALGQQDWGQLLFGAGLFAWLAIESVLLQRLYTGPALPPVLRPTLGILTAPPAVGAIAYLSVSPEEPDLVAHYLLGYALLQALLLLRMLPWIMQQPFAPSYWAFTFGATAFGALPLRMIERGDVGAVAFLAPYTFLGANLVVGIVAIGTLVLIRRWLQGSNPSTSRIPQTIASNPSLATSKGE